MEKVSDLWLFLMKEGLPIEQPGDLKTLIDINRSQMKKISQSEAAAISNFSLDLLSNFMAKDKNWKSSPPEHDKRISLMKTMLEYRRRQHIEMLDFSFFKKIVDIPKLKCLFSKSFFINFTVQESSANSLLSLQGYFLKNFIYFHLRHDMRFRASIDSYMIERDNPYTRNTIREENRKDISLRDKYINNPIFNIEDFSLYLLDNFFPNIAGIWADHSHFAPAYILQFIRIAFEYGMITIEKAKKMVPYLLRATMSLMKLEEGWVERQPEEKKFSVRIKLHNITHLFAKCREHISMIVVSILVLISDSYFMHKFQEYVEQKTSEQTIQEEMLQNFMLFDKEINDAVLFITMNYLSNNVAILEHKSTNDFCKQAVEKVFLFITTTTRDCFLNSLKLITVNDLHFFEKKDIIAEELRHSADELGNTFRKLLEMVGRGCFSQETAKLDIREASDSAFDTFMRSYIGQDPESDSPTLESICKKITDKIDKIMQIHTEFKVALVKESIPLMLVSLVDYCSDYFPETVYAAVSTMCFKLLRSIAEQNNFCKAQLFKGECWFHFKRLLSNFSRYDAYIFLFHLCGEKNASVFLGREVFASFLQLYEKKSNEICHKLDLDNPIDSLQVENCATLILMTKYLTKYFYNDFLDENEKMQNLLLTQEVVFTNLASIFLPVLINIVNQVGFVDALPTPSDLLIPELFNDDKTAELMSRIPMISATRDKQVLLVHTVFFVFKLYNRISADVCTTLQHGQLLDHVNQLKLTIESGCLIQNLSVMPVGLEAEILVFLKNLRILPETQMLVENVTNVAFNIFETSDPFERQEIEGGLKEIRQKIINLELQKKVTGSEQLQDIITQAKEEEKELKRQKKILHYSNLKFIQKAIQRLKQIRANPKIKNEGEKYVYAGLLPIILKYAEGIEELSFFDSTSKIRVAFHKIGILIKIFSEAIEDFNHLTGREVSIEGFTEAGFPPSYLSKIDLDGQKITQLPEETQAWSDSMVEERIHRGSKKLCELITEFYESTAFFPYIKARKDISKEDFTNSIYAAKFEEKTTDPLLSTKKVVLGYFIKKYQEAKDQHLHREEEPNLLGFFDRNTQNLKGVFNSCLDRLLSRTKLEKMVKTNYLSHNVPLSKFWVTPSCQAYVNMMVMLVSKSKTARKELFDFISEGRLEQAAGKQDGEGLDQEEAMTVVASPHTEEKSLKTFDLTAAVHPVSSATDKPSAPHVYPNGFTHPNEYLLTILLRIQADLVFYLSSNSTRHTIWWITHQTYEMISSFFKNLCECNYMPFKLYLAEAIPKPEDENFSAFAGKSFSEIFSEEFKFIMKTTSIARNKDPVMVPSDRHERVQEILLPLLKIISEATIGPCVENQNIFIKSDLEALCNLSTRILDDLSSEYFQLAALSLELISALTEGHDKEKLIRIANKLPASIIIDRVQRYVKKLFIQHKIKDGDIDIDKSKKKKDEDALPSNKIVPVSLESIKNKDSKQPVTIITEEMENAAQLEDWDELFELYMEEETFSDSPIFSFVFKLFVVWKTLANQSSSHSSRMKEVTDDAEKYFKKSNLFLGIKADFNFEKPTEIACIFYFLSKKILCEVEVLDDHQQSVLMYFPRLPQCFMLSEEAKRNYRAECDISDSNTKMVDLLRNFDLFKIQMVSSFKLQRKLTNLYNIISTDAFFYYTYFCWITGFILNVLLCASLISSGQSTGMVAKNSKIDSAVRVVSLILIVLSALLLLLWMISKYPQTYATRLEDYKFDNPGKNAGSLKARLYVAVISSFTKQPFPMSYSLHVVFTVLGLTVDEIFFTLNLLLIINISKTTAFVLKSILLHIDQLGLTLMLSIFVIYCYTILAMEFLYEQIKLDDDNKICDELYRCFFKKFVGRTAYDITFFMFITVIALNIIFGIIIDTFSQLRDDQNERRSLLSPVTDAENNCFVCGNTRAEFSKKSTNFDLHLVEHHDPWNYIYYIFYLKHKGEDELSGLEYMAWDGFIKKDATWIPIGTTRYLGRSD